MYYHLILRPLVRLPPPPPFPTQHPTPIISHHLNEEVHEAISDANKEERNKRQGRKSDSDRCFLGAVVEDAVGVKAVN